MSRHGIYSFLALPPTLQGLSSPLSAAETCPAQAGEHLQPGSDCLTWLSTPAKTVQSHGLALQFISVSHTSIF